MSAEALAQIFTDRKVYRLDGVPLEMKVGESFKLKSRFDPKQGKLRKKARKHTFQVATLTLPGQCAVRGYVSSVEAVAAQLEKSGWKINRTGNTVA